MEQAVFVYARKEFAEIHSFQSIIILLPYNWLAGTVTPEPVR